MKFRMKVGDKSQPGGWWEEYDSTTEDVGQFAQDMIDRFNDSLRPFEIPRVLLAVEVIEIEDET